jgi:hypothetical protein
VGRNESDTENIIFSHLLRDYGREREVVFQSSLFKSLTKKKLLFILAMKQKANDNRQISKGQLAFVNRQKEGEMMNVLWIVNTNTFLLVILIIMVSYLITQVNGLIQWLRRE